jgi:hypothetical protein
VALTVKAIENAKPGITPDGRVTNKPYKIGDALGLYLEVSPTGGKWWRLKYRYAGREKRLSLGVYPDISLAAARHCRDTYSSMLANGVDPGEHVKNERATRRADAARQIAAIRFTLDDESALSFRLGYRRLSLTPAETLALRAFLDATRAVIPNGPPCP